MVQERIDDEVGPDSDGEWVSKPDAAALLGIHRETVMGLVAEGKLEGQKIARWWVISRASIERYLAEKAAIAERAS